MVSKVVKSKYKVVVGLEVHAQLQTESKIFASDPNQFGVDANTNIGVITLGHPGVLPKLNRKAVEFAIKMGIACKCKIAEWQYFDRKNYFYPDLPKGYQITQDKTPICGPGQYLIKFKNAEGENVEKQVKIHHIHLEEDAGKSIHIEGETDTLLDYNRAGTPLIEMVTEPCIESAEEAAAFMTEIRKLVRYLDICDGNMEEGSLRCDVNVSVMLLDAKEFGTKVEVKNMNSMRFIHKAIEYEVDRQITALENGDKIIQETRSFDPNTGATSGMREKETMNDYRYFPEPDLPPFEVKQNWVDLINAKMPSLPNDLYLKYVSDYKLTDYDASLLTESKEIATYFEEICKNTINFKAASNWLMGPIKSYLNENSLEISDFPVEAKTIADLIKIIEEGKVSFSGGQKIFPELLKNNLKSPLQIAEEQNLIQQSNSDSLQALVDEVLAANIEKVKEYKAGKKGLLAMFMGEVMKKSKGAADPKITSKLLTESLAN
ncbi:MAG: Asp-tRNA(Asn)/Glu-tRNA(Gln) amidotransferase subunit GatB [Bacteroidota bacterium]